MKELGFEPTIWSLLFTPLETGPRQFLLLEYRAKRLDTSVSQSSKQGWKGTERVQPTGSMNVVNTGNSGCEMSGCLHGRSETPEPLTRESSEVGKERDLRCSLFTVSRGKGRDKDTARERKKNRLCLMVEGQET